MAFTPKTDAQFLAVQNAILSRKSIRSFLPNSIERSVVENLLELASRSPSGTNMQPWRVRVIAGQAKLELTRAILDATNDKDRNVDREWNYYPINWREPYLGRRRKVGWDMYELLGIKKGDFEGTNNAKNRNYDFFGAPVGLIFTLDKDLQLGSWLDLGIFLGTLMVAARGRGLDTCPQAAFADYHDVVRKQLVIPENEIVVCGMALGYADPNAKVNLLKTERTGISQFASFTGL